MPIKRPLGSEPLTDDAFKLRRAVTLPLLVFYGLGVTIGAGIYVLIGETVAVAGIYAPASFLLASVIMAFSAGSFCELSGRYPKSAGEAVYVDAGFRRPALTLLTGGLTIAAAMVSAAAIAVGGTGYIVTLIPFSDVIVLTVVILTLGLVAAWGIVESVTFAAIFTVIEIFGLLAVVAAGLAADPGVVLRVPDVLPPLSDASALTSVFTASLLAFFAFIGFDDVVNLAEETRNPTRTLPFGIVLTLVIATLLYFSVSAIAVLSVPIEALAISTAPISLIFGELTNTRPVLITAIAIVATLNGVVILIVMASRVIYGLGNEGRLPAALARVHPVTRTPLIATSLVTLVVLGLALWFPLGVLAERATQAILVVFTLVNAALLRIKLRGDPPPADVVVVPAAFPVLGVVGCLLMLFGPLAFN